MLLPLSRFLWLAWVVPRIQSTVRDHELLLAIIIKACKSSVANDVYYRSFAGEVLLGDLYRSGFDITDAHDQADAIVINTCGFVEDAKAESLEVSNTSQSRFIIPHKQQ